MTGTGDREAEKAAREAAWWKRWWAQDFSWRALAERYDRTDEPKKPWLGWSVTPAGRCVETRSAPAESRPATLQDYLRWDPDAKRLRSNEELTHAGLLMRSPGRPNFHILHLPQTYEDGTPTFKAELESLDWVKLENEITSLLSRSGPTDKALGKRGFSAADCRAQLDGAVLRQFPRPQAPMRRSTLHLSANYAAFLGNVAADDIDFESPTGLADTLFCLGASFTGTEFAGGDADFRRVKFFVGSANFWRVKFSGGDAKFFDAEFSGGDADFCLAVFSGGNADFRSANFSGGNAYFTGAKFSAGGAYFAGAKFSGGNARFGSADFSKGDADFKNAVFSGENAYFLNAKFQAKANFRGAQFLANCEFGQSEQQHDGAPEPGAQFLERLSFRAAYFKGLADFARVHFPERAEDRNSAFEGARFFEPLDLKGVEALPFSALHGIRLDKGLLLDSQHPVPEQFEQALKDAEAAIERDEERDPEDPGHDAERSGADARYAALEAGCRALKEAMAADGDRKREQEFFSHELAARERRVRHRLEELKAGITGLRSWLEAWSVRMQLMASQAYKLFSGYGGSILRPLATLLASFIVAAVALGFLTCAFALAGNAQLSDVCLGMECGPTMHPIASNTLEAAFRGMLGPFRLLLGRGEPFAYLGDTAPVFRGLVALVMLLHGLASSALIFLGLLALRRQFQIN